MARFAFVIHPLSPKHAAKRYPVAKYLPDSLLEGIMKGMKPQIISEITGIKSITGAETTGVFIGVPLTPHMMIGGVPLEHSYSKIVQATEMAKAEGADIIGLGAFTAVVGDGGITIAERSPIAVTTGNSYTVATAIEGVLKACNLLEIEPGRATLAVVGATGSIGRTCAKVLSESFSKTILIGRDADRTEKVASEIPGASWSTKVEDIREADAIVTVTSAGAAIVEPEYLKPGSVICDVSRPRDVSIRVAKERPDVLVIEGGVVKVPGDVDFHFDFGFPQKTAYACMSETMILALESRLESYTLGKDVSVSQVEEMHNLATKHGFELAGFRSFEKSVSQQTIESVRKVRHSTKELVNAKD